MKGIQLTQDKQIKLNNGFFVYNYDKNELSQRIVNKLLTVLDENTFDVNSGVNLFGIMLNDTVRSSTRKKEIERVLLLVDEVQSITYIAEKVEDRVLFYDIYLRANVDGVIENINLNYGVE